VPQRSNNGKLKLAVAISIGVGVLGIGSWIFAQVDSTSRIEIHDTCTTAHADIRNEISKNQRGIVKLQRSVDSLTRVLSIEYVRDSVFQHELRDDTDAMLKMLKEIKDKDGG